MPFGGRGYGPPGGGKTSKRGFSGVGSYAVEVHALHFGGRGGSLLARYQRKAPKIQPSRLPGTITKIHRKGASTTVFGKFTQVARGGGFPVAYGPIHAVAVRKKKNVAFMLQGTPRQFHSFVARHLGRPTKTKRPGGRLPAKRFGQFLSIYVGRKTAGGRALHGMRASPSGKIHVRSHSARGKGGKMIRVKAHLRRRGGRRR